MGPCVIATVLLENTLIGLSLVAAIGFGLVFNGRRVSALRTVIKTLAVGALTALALADDAPRLLILALALSAAGDAFLAGDPQKTLPFGLGAFLVAHLAYIWLFLHIGGGTAALEAEPWRAVGVFGALGAGVMMMTWLWRSIGPLRPAVSAYAAALALMVAAAFTLPHSLWPAMPGAVLFMVSDAILSAELFKGLRKSWSGPAVWATYYGAQALIAWTFMR
jgi:uncharacterized membrane protein YhhN